METNKGIRCGNHGNAKFYHATIEDVRECFAFSRAERRRRWLGEAEIPSWMTDEDPNFVRPTDGKRMRGWWDLPIAASMWRADAWDIER